MVATAIHPRSGTIHLGTKSWIFPCRSRTDGSVCITPLVFSSLYLKKSLVPISVCGGGGSLSLENQDPGPPHQYYGGPCCSAALLLCCLRSCGSEKGEDDSPLGQVCGCGVTHSSWASGLPVWMSSSLTESNSFSIRAISSSLVCLPPMALRRLGESLSDDTQPWSSPTTMIG